MHVTVYGLKNCDTCKRALKDLVGADILHQFVDIREEADRAVKVPQWIDAVGGPVLANTRSTTWRNLTAEEKRLAETDPAGLMIAHPTLIKRPVIEADGEVHVGWSPGVRQKVLALGS